MIKKNLKLTSAFLIGLALIIIVGVFLASKPRNVDDSIDSVSIEKDGGKLVVSSDGSVVFTNSDGVYFDQWDSDKTNAFFKYFGDNYQGESQLVSGAQNSLTITKGGQKYTYILNDDEIVDHAEDDAQEEDNSPAGGGGNGGSGGSGSSTPTPSGNNGSSGGNNGECLYWKLSYCVIARTPSPSAAPSGTPNPNANVIEAANCGEYLSENQTPTVINNTLCIPEPSPLP